MPSVRFLAPWHEAGRLEGLEAEGWSDWVGRSAIYHCVSRVVDRRFVFGDREKEKFVALLRRYGIPLIPSTSKTAAELVVLATNSRERIDTAFTRRLDQILEVPLPGFEERLGLWRSHLGERGPGDGVCRALAGYCDLAGGQIRNAVLTASALADGRPTHHEISKTTLRVRVFQDRPRSSLLRRLPAACRHHPRAHSRHSPSFLGPRRRGSRPPDRLPRSCRLG